MNFPIKIITTNLATGEKKEINFTKKDAREWQVRDMNGLINILDVAYAVPNFTWEMDASNNNMTAKNGDKWTGEKNEGWWIYQDSLGRLYESKEMPVDKN